ncbi:sigma-70 family RNA polymerase sigma factor [bacterium]|nr:sigma-70 family RNA polymerase sigma factor [bacterium]
MAETQPHIDMWRTAYEEYGSDLLAFLQHRVKSRHDAEDLLQETFVRVIRNGSKLRDPKRCRSYLFSTAHNLMVNFVTRKRESTMSRDEDVEFFTATLMLDDTSESPEEQTTRRELETRLKEIVGEMTPAHRQAFEMAVLQGKPYKEIAEQTGWSLSQVKINVYRARKTASEALRDWQPEDRG